jgi:hypothetical protein
LKYTTQRDWILARTTEHDHRLLCREHITNNYRASEEVWGGGDGSWAPSKFYYKSKAVSAEF